MDPHELVRLLAGLNAARRAGFSTEVLDSWGQQAVGMTYKEIADSVRNLPPEVAPKGLTTGEILKLMARGATFGAADLMDEERRRQIAKMYPEISLFAQAYGTGTGALSLVAGGFSAYNATQGGLGRTLPYLQSAQPLAAAAETSPSVGVAAQMLGEGARRLLGPVAKLAAAGAGVGGAAGVIEYLLNRKGK